MLTRAQVPDALAADTSDRDLVLCECDCEKGSPYAGGRLPEFFSTARDCAQVWARYILQQNSEEIRTLYWGVHLKKAHVLHVRNRYGLYSLVPLPFGYPSGYPVSVKE